jgi:hypothetical protein
VFVSGTLTSKTAYGLNQMLKVVTKVLGQEHEEQGVCDSTGIIDYQHNTVDDHNVSGINKEQIRIESVILVGSFAAHLRLKNNCWQKTWKIGHFYLFWFLKDEQIILIVWIVGTEK